MSCKVSRVQVRECRSRCRACESTDFDKPERRSRFRRGIRRRRSNSRINYLHQLPYCALTDEELHFMIKIIKAMHERSPLYHDPWLCSLDPSSSIRLTLVCIITDTVQRALHRWNRPHPSYSTIDWLNH